MAGVQTLTVAPEDGEQRLDRWFRRLFPQVTQGQVQKYLRTGQIRVDGKRAEANLRLMGGETIRIPPLPPAGAKPLKPKTSDREAEALRELVLFKDDWVIALNKPAGLAVQGGSKLDRHLDAMLDSLAFDGERPRLVHRLDRDTSGVLLLARTRQAAQRLGLTFRDHHTRKYYWAIVTGVPKPHQGKINAPLAKLGGARGERMEIDEDEGRDAVTLYQVVDHAMKAAWVALWPLTGRTHQLRAHMEAIGTPILGETKYTREIHPAEVELSFPDLGNVRLHLHARRLILPHPSGKGKIDVSAPLPPEMKKTWDYFGFGKNDGDPFAGINPK
jgi:23S rRNA pseudouridine955/2504/2580 synthase